MTHFSDTVTTPVPKQAKSPPAREKACPEPDRDQTSFKLEMEANNDPEQAKSNSGPELEIIVPPPDLKKLFTFDGGYCNPPKGSWYQPGTSGNPGGRPKGSKNKPKSLTDRNFKEILRSVLYSDVKTGGGRTISTARALTENLADLALRNNLPAIKLAMTALHAIDAADAAQQEREYNYAVAYKARWDSTNSMVSGSDRALAVPQPDDIMLDHKNRMALFKGPRNEEEMWKNLRAQDYQKEEEDEEIERNEIAREAPDEMRSGPLPERWEEGEALHLRPDEEPRLRNPYP